MPIYFPRPSGANYHLPEKDTLIHLRYLIIIYEFTI